jgi:hypothetical protein
MLSEIAAKGAFTEESMDAAWFCSRIKSFIKFAHKIHSFALTYALGWLLADEIYQIA